MIGTLIKYIPLLPKMEPTFVTPAKTAPESTDASPYSQIVSGKKNTLDSSPPQGKSAELLNDLIKIALEKVSSLKEQVEFEQKKKALYRTQLKGMDSEIKQLREKVKEYISIKERIANDNAKTLTEIEELDTTINKLLATHKHKMDYLKNEKTRVEAIMGQIQNRIIDLRSTIDEIKSPEKAKVWDQSEADELKRCIEEKQVEIKHLLEEREKALSKEEGITRYFNKTASDASIVFH